MVVHSKQGLRSSGQIAKFRAAQTVSSDRLACTPEEFSLMKKEIMDILSRYLCLGGTVTGVRIEIVHEIRQGVPYVKTVQIK